MRSGMGWCEGVVREARRKGGGWGQRRVGMLVRGQGEASGIELAEARVAVWMAVVGVALEAAEHDQALLLECRMRTWNPDSDPSNP